MLPLSRLLCFTLLLATASLGLQVGCGGGSTSNAPAPPPVPTNILEYLRTTPGLTDVTEVTTSISGTRGFRFRITQPVDHTVPKGASFAQFATLLHRGASAPTVLATTGYSISQNPYQGEPTRLLGGNQLTLEHRFFQTSTPNPVDWTKLTIQQAAADEHRLVTLLKPFYTGKWVNTGGSKGGMTALFHRRFYPADVDATLAYVAPINLANGDLRYIPFVDTRGGASNRAAIEAWQQAVLNRRSEVRALLEADAAASGNTLAFLGSEKTLEFAVLEAPFTLWQYGNATLASQVPPPTASPQELYTFLDRASFGVVDAWSDATLDYYKAYYQQCANQLGYPAVEEAHLTGLRFPGMDLPQAYPPLGASKAYDGGAAMRDIQAWISTSAERVMLVYGENDPWSAGALDVPAAAQGRQVRKYFVPGGNHGASLSQLPSADRAEASQLLGQWMGVPVTPAAAPAAKGEQAMGQELSDTFVVRRGGRVGQTGRQ